MRSDITLKDMTTPEISRRSEIGYASGNLGKSLFWTSLEYLLLFYMTDIVGISPVWAGFIIVVSLVWDGITDPLMGYWIDRRSSGGHDYRPYLRWGPPLCGLAFGTIFYVPYDTEFLKAVYLLIVNLLFRTVYTLFDVPHNALLAKMPADTQRRTNLSAWRYFFSSIGGLTVAVAVAPLLSERGEHGDTSAFLIFALIATAMACATIWQSMPIAKSVARHTKGAVPAMTPMDFLNALKDSSTAGLFFAIAAINALTLPLYARMAPYIAKYAIGDQQWAGSLFLAFTLGQVLAMPIWTIVGYRFGKPKSCIAAYLVLIITLCLGAFFSSNPYMLVAISALGGFAVGALNMLVWALAPDVVDQVERPERGRPDAMFMSFLTLTQKSAIGVGSLLAGAVLSLTGFVVDEAQDDFGLAGIIFLAFGVPTIGALVGIALARQIGNSPSKN